MRVALLFTDGVGVGARAPDTNPLARAELLLSQFDDGTGTPLPNGLRFDVDTTFGVAGRPQSASNQTAIHTGLPAPKLLGRHVLGFPNAPLRALLSEHSVARRVTSAGKQVAFANAYPAAWLDALGLARRPSRQPDVVVSEKHRRRARPSAGQLAMAAGGLALNTFDDARAGHGLTQDIDGSHAARRRFSLPRRSPAEAAEIFWALSADYTVFEHYLADEAGHLQDADLATAALETFDRFARAVLALRPVDTHVLIVSDHGNVEDLRTRSHTRNRVAVLSFGPGNRRPLRLETVADVGTTALSLLEVA